MEDRDRKPCSCGRLAATLEDLAELGAAVKRRERWARPLCWIDVIRMQVARLSPPAAEIADALAQQLGLAPWGHRTAPVYVMQEAIALYLAGRWPESTPEIPPDPSPEPAA